MAKSDRSLEEIDLNRAYTGPRTAAWGTDKRINGLDTETVDGDIFAISVAWDGSEGMVQHNDREPLTPSQIWQVLTDYKARSALNMWYNLDFDANVLLKAVLDKESLAELVVSGATETEEYQITYIQSKFLEIKHKENRNVCTHYDASQFFYTTLENAVSEWLDESKANDGLEAGLFGSNDPQQLEKIVENSDSLYWFELPVSEGDEWTLRHAWQYITDNWTDILHYAQRDAELVRNLWQKAVEVGESLEIPMGRPFSTGYLAESYLNFHMREKPGLGPREMAKIAWDSYAGGRFEVLKRGNVGRVVGPDINSAYPAILSELPDPKTLRWKRANNASISEIESSDYGFIRANVTTDPNRAIQPFAVKHEKQDKLVYPALTNQEVTCVKDIFIHAHKEGYILDYEPKEIWLGYETEGTWFPFNFVKPLYQDRQEAKKNGYGQRETLLKIVLNSMYGKTCQTTPKRRELGEPTDLENHENYVPDLSLPKLIREKYSEGFIESLQAGAWFNPFLASYITGLTRLELHKRITQYGLEDNTIMLATDCLMIEEEPFKKTDFKKDLVKDGLGYWDMEYSGGAFVIGAGVYQIDFDSPEKPPKVKTRGFSEADLEKGLVNAAQKANGHIDIESTRPRTVAEVIWSNQELGNVGNFLRHEREIKPEMDTKRQWPSDTGFQELLEACQQSRPIEI